MPRQRDTKAEYRRRAERAKAQGTTYGKQRYQQDKERAKREGYPSPRKRAKAVTEERKRQRAIQRILDQTGQTATAPFPDRDTTDRQIIGLMQRFHAPEGAIAFVLEQENRWQAFRAWYAMMRGWAA